MLIRRSPILLASWAHGGASRLPGLQGMEKVSTTSSSKGIWRS